MHPGQILQLLKKEYPHAKYYLNFSNPLELMVAAILSAQCRDETVNKTTEKLFKKYKTASDYVKATGLENDIRSITFASAKEKNIRNACKILVEKHKGQVPKTAEGLTELPGIGRKTANAIMQNAFNVVEGVVIDAHCIRVAYRLGLTKEKNPEKIEQDIMKLYPKSDWKIFPHLMKNHGRAVCQASTPYCSKCVLAKMCPKQGVTKRL